MAGQELFIIALSIIVFAAMVVLRRVNLMLQLGFDEHLFAKINAVINSAVSILLLAGLIAVKGKKYLFIKE